MVKKKQTITLQEQQISIDFIDVIEAFKFDDRNKHRPSHTMKAVDFIAEYQNYYVFLEVKDPRSSDEKTIDERVNNLKLKFRDSFICRYMQSKVDKEIRYICFLSIETPLLLNLNKKLNQLLPTEVPYQKQDLVSWCVVLNEEKWNKWLSKSMRLRRI